MQMWSRRQWLRNLTLGAAVVLLDCRPGGAGEWQPPSLHKQLLTRLQQPYSGEPVLADLCASWLTPAEYFYVLNHGSVPELHVDQYRLTVDGAVRRPLELSFAELRARFRRIELPATLMCAGNRRDEFSEIRQVKDPLQWGPAALGTARWAGVPLAEVLRHVGVKAEAKHVWFESYDRQQNENGQETSFGGSIPLARAMQAGQGPVLLTYEMNGAPLPRLHGFPLRVMVPGFIGARSVKWLRRIHVSREPSTNPHFRTAHRIFREAQAKISSAPPIYEYPINSAIFLPEGATIQEGMVPVAGYALAPGIEQIAHVEVSADAGRTWHQAQLQGPIEPYCWRLWRARLPVTGATDSIMARAVTTSGTRQPKTNRWNVGGYLYNAWPRVPVKVES